jgi:hypothetical protein
MKTTTITPSWSDSSLSLSNPVTIQSDFIIDESISVPNGTVGESLGYSINIGAGAIKVLFISSDRNITLADSSSTLTIVAGIPLWWYAGCGFDCPIGDGGDGLLLITNSSGATANVEIRIGDSRT